MATEGEGESPLPTEKGESMSYEPPLNDPVFEGEGDDEELSPEFDTLEEMEMPE